MTILGVAIVEWRTPYAFCQDDNRDGFLPMYVHSLRGLEQGELAQWNRHQSLGLPHLANGQSAAFHPLPPLCLLISRVTVGHDFAAIEWMVLVGLVLGAAGMIRVAAELELGPVAASFGALSWSLCPFIVYSARSWQNYAALCSALPWILWVLLRIARGRFGVPELLVGTVAHLWVFYLGAVQWVAVVLVFEALLLAGLIWPLLAPDRRREALRVVGMTGVLAFTVAISSLPLLLPMWGVVSSSQERAASLTYELFAAEPLGLRALLSGWWAPWIEGGVAHPDRSFTESASPASLTHLGYPVVLLLAATPWFLRRLPPPIHRRVVLLLLLGTTGLLWSLGALSPLLYQVPVLNRFRWQFKAYPMGAFFLILAVTVFLGALERRWGRRRAGAVLAAQTINLFLVIGAPEERGFFVHLDDLPLEEPLAAALGKGRILTVGQQAGVGESAHTAPLLGFDFATLFGLEHFGGYDPLMPAVNAAATLRLNYTASFNLPPESLPLDYLRYWGVRWYVVRSDLAEAFRSRSGEVLQVLTADPRRTVMEDPGARPLVRSARGLCSARVTGGSVNSLEVSFDCSGDDVGVIAYLAHPQIGVEVDGAEAPLQVGGVGEIVVPLSAGRHRVEVTYSEPLIRVGAILAAIWWAGLGGAILWRARRSRGVAPPSSGAPGGSGPIPPSPTP